MKGTGIKEIPCADCKYLPYGLNNEPCHSCLAIVRSEVNPDCRHRFKNYKRVFLNFEKGEA